VVNQDSPARNARAEGDHATAELVSSFPAFTMETRFDPRAAHVAFVVDKVALGEVIL